MAERRPLVLANGRLNELPVGDTVAGASGGASTLPFTASGAITSGQPVVLNADGTASVITNTNASLGSLQTQVAVSSASVLVEYIPTVDRFVMLWIENQATKVLKCSLGTRSGETVSWGAAATVMAPALTTTSGKASMVWDSTAQVLVVHWSYNDATPWVYGVIRAATITASAITWGSTYNWITPAANAFSHASGTNGPDMAFCEAQGRTVLVYSTTLATAGVKALTITMAGTVPTFGTPVLLTATQNGSGVGPLVAYDKVSGAMVYMSSSTTDCVGIKVEGAVITAGTALRCNASVFNGPACLIPCDSGVVAFYLSSSGVGLSSRVITSSSVGAISQGSEQSLGAAITYGGLSGRQTYTGNCGLIARSPSLTSYNSLYVSGTTVSLLSTTTIASYTAGHARQSLGCDSSRAVLGVVPSNALTSSMVVQDSGTTLKSNNLLGFSTNGVSNGQTVNVSPLGSKVTGLSGLVTGQTYYVSYTGALTQTVTANKAGVALGATSLLFGVG